jgi:DNA polymerase-3 subunit chi
MTETLFYHLERRQLEDVLPGLVEKSLGRGWRALIRTDSAERSDALDTLLWTYDEQSFLPHAQAGEGDPALQPVLITMEEGNPNKADIFFYVGGTAPAAWRDVAGLSRVVLLFDGRDAAALGGARAAWKDAKAAGLDVTYWKESPSGKFEKQGQKQD